MLKNDVIGDEICGKLHPAEKDMSMTASGKTLTLTNTLEKPFELLRLFGKSEQNKTNGLNLFNYTNIKNGFVSNAGTGEEFSFLTNSGFPNAQYVEILVEANTNYSFDFSGIFNTDKNSGDVGRIRFGNDKNICVKDTQLINNSSKGSILQNESTKIFILALHGFNKNVEKGMLNKGVTIKPYEPYTGGIPSPNINYPQEIISSGENGEVTVSVNGKNLLPFVIGDKGEGFEVFEDGVFVSGEKYDTFYATGSSNAAAESSYENVPELIPGDYYIGINTTNVKLFITVWRNGASKSFNSASPSTPVKITIQKGDKFRIFFRIESSTFAGKVKAMITRNEASLADYEPYRKQKLVISTPNGLPGIPVNKDGNYTDEKGQQWICDEIDLGRGKYVQRVAYETIDKSTLNIVALGENTHRFSMGKTKNVYTNNTHAMSNFAKYFDWANANNSFCVNKNIFYYGHTESTTVEEIEKLFNALPEIEILGQLAESIEHDLTAEEIAAYKALHTYAGTTVLSNDADVWMETKYKAKPVGMRNWMVK